MRDHLKAAAKAAELSDVQLLAMRVKIKDWEHPSALEQAVLDEIALRRESYHHAHPILQQSTTAPLTMPE